MMNVLLLNVTYEPLESISVRRALDLLLQEKAHGVEGLAQRLRSVRRTVEIPSVMRLTYYVNVPQRNVSWSRYAVLERDDYTCVYCGMRPGIRKNGRFYYKRDFTLDHIIPRSRGGGNTWGNTACACAPCNQRKADRTPHEAGMKMRFEPKTPRTNTLVVRGQIPTEWVKYLDL